MNMLLRFFILMTLIKPKKNKQFLTPEKLTQQKISQSYHVLPHDLGWRNHLPNYRYLSFIELNITRWFFAVKQTATNQLKWLIAAQQMVYLKEVKLFDRLTVNTVLEGWDGKYLYFTHQFFVKDTLVAVAMTKIIMVSKQGKYLPADIGLVNSKLTNSIVSWQENHTAIKQAD